MKLYISRPKKGIEAVCEFSPEAKTFTVLQGSRVSTEIAHSEKFRGAASILKSRAGSVKDRIVINDIVFKSASTAANYVTGSSTNGLTAWKNEKGISLKEILK